MRKLIVPCLCLNFLLIAGCSWFHPYQPDVQQGNLISSAMAAQVRPGMSKAQVESTLGSSVLANRFDDNHWAYVYTFQHNGGVITKKNLDIYFKNNQVSVVSNSEGKAS